ncbi:MAG: hypothetical protein QOI58_3086 [Thermoanaerobaculia bacterium]|jgi:hypothetical protein|nr:hypothetical protein [Thermoanaerobaculia bacterium]
MPKHSKKHKGFIDAVVKISGGHEEAAEDFFLVKKSELHDVFGAEGETGGKCVLWGVDPTTGQPVCLKRA